MREIENGKIVTEVMHALARGDTKPFAEAMADDFTWRMMGHGSWGKVYLGKDKVRDDMFVPLTKQYADRYTNTATNILADGDFVIVESQGAVRTKQGKAYNNRYCFVIRMADDKMRELREYCDTALADEVLLPLAS